MEFRQASADDPIDSTLGAWHDFLSFDLAASSFAQDSKTLDQSPACDLFPTNLSDCDCSRQRLSKQGVTETGICLKLRRVTLSVAGLNAIDVQLDVRRERTSLESV